MEHKKLKINFFATCPIAKKLRKQAGLVGEKLHEEEKRFDRYESDRNYITLRHYAQSK